MIKYFLFPISFFVIFGIFGQDTCCINKVDRETQIMWHYRLYSDIYYRIESERRKAHDQTIKKDSMNMAADSINKWFYLRDSFSYIRYGNGDCNNIGKPGNNKSTFIIPDSVKKNSRFGNLKNNESMDLYQMCIVPMYYDSSWDWDFLLYDVDYRRRNFITDPPYPIPCGVSHERPCLYEYIKKRLCFIYDIDTTDMKRLAIKGETHWYYMLRRITITKTPCYYHLQYYNDFFIEPGDTHSLNAYINMYQNKPAAKLQWLPQHTWNTTFAYYPGGSGYRAFDLEFLMYYSHTLCGLELRKKQKKDYLNPKKLGNPQKYLQSDGPFMSWMVMDFHDGCNKGVFFKNNGEYIFYPKPYQIIYNDLWGMNEPSYTLPLRGRTQALENQYYSILRYWR